MCFELDQVSFSYPDGTLGLDRISVKIGQGDSIALLGANGSGKSTLLRLMAGLQFAHTGDLEFHGQALTEQALGDQSFRQNFRSRVGVVFQSTDAQLFNSSVYDEIAFGPRQLGLDEVAVDQRVRDTAHFLGIEHLFDRAPFRLSGGEKRRVALASVLSMNPEVLMFDEPFLGLDPKGQAWLVRTLRELNLAGKTIIVATHTMDMLERFARRAIVLDEAHRLVFSGELELLLENQKLLIQANLIEAAEERACA